VVAATAATDPTPGKASLRLLATETNPDDMGSRTRVSMHTLGVVAAGLAAVLIVAVVAALGWVAIGTACQVGDGSEQASYPWTCYGSRWPLWALVIPVAGEVVGAIAWVRTIRHAVILVAALIGLAIAITVLLLIPQANPRYHGATAVATTAAARQPTQAADGDRPRDRARLLGT